MTDTLTEKIIASAIEVYRILGPGLLESIYEEALCYEFSQRGLDLVVNKEVVVEIKSVRKLEDIFTAQVLSYLRSTGLNRALLINFGEKRLVDGVKRFSL